MNKTDPDPTRFVRLFAENERRIRAFLFTLLPSPDDVDEVMQEVSSVLWKKFDDLEDDSGFLSWSYVIARYEVLTYRRSKARDRHVFSEGLIQTLVEDYRNGSEHARDQRRQALEMCLSELEDEDRKLVLRAYSSGMKINQLAKQIDRTVNSLYKTMSRLRQRLFRCVDIRTQSAE